MEKIENGIDASSDLSWNYERLEEVEAIPKVVAISNMDPGTW